MPGAIVQALRRAGSSNPVLMLDEVEKLGRDSRSDPTAALLEVLDPAQVTRLDSTRLDSTRLGSARLGSTRLGSTRLGST